MADYEPLTTLLKRLKEDSGVKAKKRAEFGVLLNRMRDGRNIINLVALNNTSIYQTWWKKEKASAFERLR